MTDNIVAHFDALTTTYDSVQRARAQIEALTPLLADCDRYERLGASIDEADAQRAALRYFFAQRTSLLLETERQRLERELARHTSQRQTASEQLEGLRAQQRGWELQRAGLGGGRLGELERQLEETSRLRTARQQRAKNHAVLLEQAGLAPVTDAEQFTDRRQDIARDQEDVDAAKQESREALEAIAVESDHLRQQAQDLNAELVSLRSRRGNIPRKQLELRMRLCQELGIEESTLPFAGELIQVREDEQAWAGAAERLLRGFALSLLVPADQYGRVSGWINDHHLGTRLVYFRVPDKIPPRRTQYATSGALFTKLEVRQDSPFAHWLAGELERLASHNCAENFARTAHISRCCQTTTSHALRGQPLQQSLGTFLLGILRIAKCPGHQRLQEGHRAVRQRIPIDLQPGCDDGEQRSAQYLTHHARLTAQGRSIPAEAVDQRRRLFLLQPRHDPANRLVHRQAGTGREQDAPALPGWRRGPAETLIQQFLAAYRAGLIQRVHHQSDTTCCGIPDETCCPDCRVDHTTLNVLGMEKYRNGGLRIDAGRSDVLLVLTLCCQRLTRPEVTLQDHYTAFGRGNHRRGKGSQPRGVDERTRHIERNAGRMPPLLGPDLRQPSHPAFSAPCTPDP
ncbi:hypothetical protein [Streptomyces hawaiiensis]|uniref:hypothetical protein n=1 Tax=Streptomyces hawaiiensis TaxID=67305 RepID=UPI003652CEE4